MTNAECQALIDKHLPLVLERTGVPANIVVKGESTMLTDESAAKIHTSYRDRWANIWVDRSKNESEAEVIKHLVHECLHIHFIDNDRVHDLMEKLRLDEVHRDVLSVSIGDMEEHAVLALTNVIMTAYPYPEAWVNPKKVKVTKSVTTGRRERRIS